MKSIKDSRIGCYDSIVVLKKSIHFITEIDSTGLSELSWQIKKVKTGETLGDEQNLQKF